MKIGTHELTGIRHPFLIAEVGISHHGSIDNATIAIDAASEMGFDAVKFQHYSTNVGFPTADGAMRKRFADAHISNDDLFSLKERAENQGLIFLCTPRDEFSIDLLIEMKVGVIKIGSGMMALASRVPEDISLIISTGMIDDKELSDKMVHLENRKPAILHCVSSYPTHVADAKLLRIAHLQYTYPNLAIGYSDHVFGTEAAVVATALGAKIIEKHIHLTKPIGGVDHFGALRDRQSMRNFTRDVRMAWLSLGLGHKDLMYQCERRTAEWALT